MKGDNLKIVKENPINVISPIKLKDNPSARENLAKALFEDEEIKRRSVANSLKYLMRKEKEDVLPTWLVYLFWFVLGMVTMISLDSVIMGVLEK